MLVFSYGKINDCNLKENFNIKIYFYYYKKKILGFWK